MMNAKKYFVVTGLITLLLISSITNAVEVSGSQTPAPAANGGLSAEDVKDIQRFGSAIQLIKSYYVDSVADQKLFEGALRGMVEGLDPHSAYLNSDDLKDLQEETTGEFSGLGLQITMRDRLLKVISPIDGGPAQKAGIKPADTIVLIDKTPVDGMSMTDAVKKMRGKKGTSVVLTIVRQGEDKPLKFKLVRADIQVPSVTNRLLEEGYGYIKISSFQEDTGTMLEQAVTDLKHRSKGTLKGIVLDLRDNPGGLLDAAVQVADDFIDVPKSNKETLIVYTKGRLPDSNVKFDATPGDILNGAPIVVLINEGTASAAEIVTGALQDDKRAIIAGTNSFGKGSVQTVIPLDANSAIKLTTALYYTPSGRSIQAKGIQPDIVLGDFKVMPNKDADDDLNIKEADLTGHLSNPTVTNSGLSLGPKEIPDLPSNKQLATTDYQVYEALNLLKDEAVVQRVAANEANN